MEVVALPSADPWDQMPREGSKAYTAFRMYLEGGGQRSVAAVARELRKSEGLLRRWKRQWSWSERVAAWDDHLLKESNAAWRDATRAAPDAIREMNERHAKMAVALQTKALQRLGQLDAQELDARGVLAFLMEAAKLERLARGESMDAQAENVIEQEVVVNLLADPQGRALAVQLAQRVHATTNGQRNGISAG